MLQWPALYHTIKRIQMKPTALHKLITVAFYTWLTLFISTVSPLILAEDTWDYWSEYDDESEEKIDHDAFATLLQRYVDAKHPSGVNRFDYDAVSTADKMTLDDYIDELADEEPGDYSRAEQMAYWINLYNALTIQVIIDRKPWKSILNASSGLIPKGPWDDVLITVAEQPITLNDIEHRILRPLWNDYRIHFAVNCASYGCPNLQPEPFYADQLEQQLTLAAEQYLQHERGLKFKGKKLVLSKIFKWYVEDFGTNQAELLTTLSRHVDSETKEKLIQYKKKISYSYDWSLNKP